MRAFDVYLHKRLIDTVFYGDSSVVNADEVRKSLIEHDGYDSSIVVRSHRPRKKRLQQNMHRRLASTRPHGLCATAGICMEHAQDPSVQNCKSKA